MSRIAGVVSPTAISRTLARRSAMLLAEMISDAEVEVAQRTCVVHRFRLASADDVDEEVCSWFAEAYAVGEQHHIGRPIPRLDHGETDAPRH